MQAGSMQKPAAELNFCVGFSQVAIAYSPVEIGNGGFNYKNDTLLAQVQVDTSTVILRMVPLDNAQQPPTTPPA